MLEVSYSGVIMSGKAKLRVPAASWPVRTLVNIERRQNVNQNFGMPIEGGDISYVPSPSFPHCRRHGSGLSIVMLFWMMQKGIQALKRKIVGVCASAGASLCVSRARARKLSTSRVSICAIRGSLVISRRNPPTQNIFQHTTVP